MTSYRVIHRRFCKAKRRIELGVAKPGDKDTVKQLAVKLGYNNIKGVAS